MFDDGFGTEMPCMPRGGEFMQRANEGAVDHQWYIHLSLKVKAATSKVQSARAEQGNRGEPSCMAWITFKTRGSEEEEDLIWHVRERSRAWMTIGSGTMATSTLSSVVLMRSFRERALVDAIHVPGVTCQWISKSCKNKDQ